MQEIAALFYEILKYVFIGGILLLFAHWLFSPHISTKNSLQAPLVSKDEEYTILRLQGYERLVLFIERIRPSALLVRLQQPAFNAIEFQELLLRELRNEFEYNVTQQLYVSDRAWGIVKKLREDTVALIYGASKQLSDDSNALAYSKAILEYVSSLEVDPYDSALVLLKKELKEDKK